MDIEISQFQKIAIIRLSREILPNVDCHQFGEESHDMLTLLISASWGTWTGYWPNNTTPLPHKTSPMPLIENKLKNQNKKSKLFSEGDARLLYINFDQFSCHFEYINNTRRMQLGVIIYDPKCIEELIKHKSWQGLHIMMRILSCVLPGMLPYCSSINSGHNSVAG